MSNRSLQLEPVEAQPPVLPKRRDRPPKRKPLDIGLQQPPQPQLPRKRGRPRKKPLPSDTQKTPKIPPRPVRIHYNIPDSQSNHHQRKIEDLTYYGHNLHFWNTERSGRYFIEYNYDNPLPFRGFFGHIWESDGGDYLSNHLSRPHTYPGEVVNLTRGDDEDDTTDMEEGCLPQKRKIHTADIDQTHEQTPE